MQGAFVLSCEHLTMFCVSVLGIEACERIMRVRGIQP